MGVLIIRPLASGVLATDVQHERMMPAQYVDGYARDDWHENEVRKAKACFDVLSTGDEPRAGTAVRWALGHEAVSGVLVGLADLEQLDVALTAGKAGALGAENMAALEPVHQSLFGRRDGPKL